MSIYRVEFHPGPSMHQFTVMDGTQEQCEIAVKA
mgnify:CR=1 FL=1